MLVNAALCIQSVYKTRSVGLFMLTFGPLLLRIEVFCYDQSSVVYHHPMVLASL